MDLVPPQGIRLTPRHYALEISEGRNHRCSFCIIPSMRGDLASRPIGEVMLEAERLVQGGEEMVCHLAGHERVWRRPRGLPTGFWAASPSRPASPISRVRLARSARGCACTTCIPYPHVDEVIPLMADGKAPPYLDVPFQHGAREC